MRRGLRCLGVATGVLLALGSATASAIPLETLPVEALTPANGASILATTEPIPFQLSSPIVSNSAPCLGGGVHVRISSQNLLAQAGPFQGLLAQEYVVEAFELHSSETVLGLNAGASRAGYQWSQIPVTYYWQANVICFGSLVQYATPVYSLQIVNPPLNTTEPETPPERLTVARAAAEAKWLIRTRTHHNAYRAAITCHLTGQRSATCHATWYTARQVLPSTSLYSGTFKVNANNDPVNVSFHGNRAQSGCVASHRRGCFSPVTWR